VVIVMLYDITGVPIGDKFTKLGSPEEKEAQQIMAEFILNLSAPQYTGPDATSITFAIARQIDFQMEQGITPEVMKSIGNAKAGLNTSYRDRYLDPVAWRIIEAVTKVATVGFSPPGRGA
jgi:hypothetical protein